MSRKWLLIIIVGVIAGALLYFRYRIPPVLALTKQLGLEIFLTDIWVKLQTVIQTSPQIIFGVATTAGMAAVGKITGYLKDRAASAAESALNTQWTQTTNKLQTNVDSLQTKLQTVLQENLSLETQVTTLNDAVAKLTDKETLAGQVQQLTSQLQQETYEKSEAMRLYNQIKDKVENPPAEQIA